MNDLTHNFGIIYHPVKAFVVFERIQSGMTDAVYVESYDIDAQGCPVNAHPLSVKEGNALAKALTVAERRPQDFLQPKGLLPRNILYLRTGTNGFAVWHTPKQRVKLLFTDTLGIPNGEAEIPAIVWKASKSQLLLFALNEEDMQLTTPLFYAPFFNTYNDGRVCMGNVQVAIPKDCSLEQFLTLWQDYFFNSYFSHLLSSHQPVKANIVQLWQALINSSEPFPPDVLILSKYQIKNLLP